MNCFPCFTSQRSKKSNSKRELHAPAPQEQVIMTRTPDIKKQIKPDDPNQVDTANIQAQNFTFRELAIATKNFRQECLMGEGGFGRVYKGTIPATGQVVAVKQLDRNGMHSSKEFLVEVLMLSLLNHDSLVKLIGYCADGDQRLLVYEFMPGGSLESRLLERRPDEPPLDWYSRMKVATNIAKGLWYLHDKANPPVIYRDLKSSNILLDNDLNAKLADYGLAKLAGKDKMNIVPTRVMGTYGYSAPEYVSTGNLTLKSDVYSFGVVLLELITGRRAIDTTRPHAEQNLVSWAQPIFRDPKRYPDMADPLLNKNFPEKDLNQVVAIAAMCLQEEAAARPLMSDVVTALSFLSTSPPAVVPATSASQKSAAGESESESESEAESGKSIHSSDEEEGNGAAQNQVAASAKYQESDTTDTEYDYYENENQQDYSPQDTLETKEFYSKSSRKSSTRSRNETISSGTRSNSSSYSEDGSVSTGHKSSVTLSQKSSKKSSVRERDLSQKSCKKSSVRERDLSKKSSKKSSAKDRDLSQKSSKRSSVKDRDLSQKSTKKSSTRDISKKSSKKSSVRDLSHKKSTGMGSEERNLSSHGNVNSSSEESHDEGADLFEHSSSKPSQRYLSFGIVSGESYHESSRMSHEGSSIHLDHTSSRGSDVHHYDRTSIGSEEGTLLHFNNSSSRRSDEGSVHS